VQVEEDNDEVYRRRLEGRAELLAATRLRYRALVQLMGGLRWRSKLLRNVAVLRETATVQSEVEEALAYTEQRIAAEGWSARTAVVQATAEVRALLPQLQKKTLKRLGPRAPGSLGEQLLALEALVAASPRVVLPGQRWSTATALLPLRLPELQAVARFGAALEAVFKRPLTPAARLPFSDAELARLEAAWPEGEAALQTAWQRLASSDLTGSMVRHVRKRATRMPRAVPVSGAEHLVACEFWRTFSLARLREVAAARVSPVVALDSELLPVVRWLLARENDALVRLGARPGSLSKARSGLFELAHELSGLSAQRSSISLVWERLRERAAQADAGPVDADVERLRDTLRLFLRVVGSDPTPSIYRTAGTSPQALPPRDSPLLVLVGALERKVATGR
jgi:hypothetical protein